MDIPVATHGCGLNDIFRTGKIHMRTGNTEAENHLVSRLLFVQKSSTSCRTISFAIVEL